LSSIECPIIIEPKFVMTKVYKRSFGPVLVLLLGAVVFGQAGAKKGGNKAPAKTTNTTAASANPSPTPEPPANVPGKRNERPGSTSNQAVSQAVSNPKVDAADAPYFYEFTQPKFVVTKITITHDERGKGTLTFHKGEFDEPITEPVQLSQATLDKINATLTALDYLNSAEDYQYEKDYSHLGNIAFRLKKDGREREVHYNYTTNKDAKELMDAYRRISNQIIWMFDINVARVNQPLDAPRQMDALDSYMQRNEIADPSQLVPFLKGLTDDERIPLIARNHAGKMIKQIEKASKK
jgi:hypothetical protein